jgi:hypothetical protein
MVMAKTETNINGTIFLHDDQDPNKVVIKPPYAAEMSIPPAKFNTIWMPVVRSLRPEKLEPDGSIQVWDGR